MQPESAMFQVFGAFRDAFAELPRADWPRAHQCHRSAVAIGATSWPIHRFNSNRRELPPPVEVLGVLESAGLKFDALWVLGLDEITGRLPHARIRFCRLPSNAARPIPEIARSFAGTGSALDSCVVTRGTAGSGQSRTPIEGGVGGTPTERAR